MDAHHGLDAERIKAALPLNEIIAEDGHDLRRSGSSHICLCMFHDERSPSLRVHRDFFKCFGCGSGGDVFNYWQWTRNVDFPTAKRELAARAGINGVNVSPSPIRRAPVKRAVQPLPPVPTLAKELGDVLAEGGRYLRGTPRSIGALAEWRGWPVEATEAAVEAGLITAPTLYHSQRRKEMRVVAFPVWNPEPGANGEDRQVHVGAHFREFKSLEPLADANGKALRPAWYFTPHARENRGELGVPSLPMVLGNFSRARLLVVIEGEWDLLTLAIAEGWVARGGSQWPDGLCAIGIRGASGVNVFLRHWRRFWPIDAEALLIADNDEAGATWSKARRGDESFLDRMRALCRRAGAASMTAPHKDLNDAFRAGQWPAGSLQQLLKVSGFTYSLSASKS